LTLAGSTPFAPVNRLPIAPSRISPVVDDTFTDEVGE
jgi:hypothetical protein